MSRTELQQLAQLRLEDAEALLAASRWPAAYYLLGYCIECALKACVAKLFRTDEVPERKLVNSFYTHRLDELLTISGVKADFEARAGVDPNFDANWNTVLAWNEASRYDVTITELMARALHAAVTNAPSGILPWLRTQW